MRLNAPRILRGSPTLESGRVEHVNTFHGLYQMWNIPLGWQRKTQLPLLVGVVKMSFMGLFPWKGVEDKLIFGCHVGPLYVLIVVPVPVAQTIVARRSWKATNMY